MTADLQVPKPKPRWHPDRKNDPYIIEEYDPTYDEWIEIKRTLSGREAEDLLVADPNAKRRMFLEQGNTYYMK
tara:strand:+ start:3959 stop:4177 length:219 start_codon:yes stop_codon:yes gene_type:complete